MPVFLGYLGSAVHFVFRNPKESSESKLHPDRQLLGLLIRGPVIVFGLATVAALVAFGAANRRNGPPGSGIGLDTLASILAVVIGLLSATTGAAVSYLFDVKREA